MVEIIYTTFFRLTTRTTIDTLICYFNLYNIWKFRTRCFRKSYRKISYFKSIPFYKGDKEDDANKVFSVRWNFRDLICTIKTMMDWDLSIDSFRAYGEMLEEEDAMIFDLSKAEKFE